MTCLVIFVCVHVVARYSYITFVIITLQIVTLCLNFAFMFKE